MSNEKKNPRMVLYRTRCDRYQAILDSQELNAAEKLVLAAMVSHLLSDNPICWPSQMTLAKCSGQTVRNVQRVLQQLCAKGFLKYKSSKLVPSTKKVDGEIIAYDRLVYEFDVSEDGTYLFEIDWDKLPVAKRKGRLALRGQDYGRKKRASQPAGGTTRCQGEGRHGVRERGDTVSYERGTKGTGNKRERELAGTESRLPPPGSGLTAGEGGRSSSGAGDEQPLTPAKHPERFLQWLQERQERLPHLPPFGSADEAAWAKVWDANTEFHEDGGAFYLLDAIDGNDYWSGREGDPPFLMKPQFLLGKHEGEERWRLVMLGNFHSLGRTYQEIIDAKARLLKASVDDFLNSHEKPKEAMQEPKLLLRSLAHGGRFECNPYLIEEFRLLLAEEIEHRAEKKARREADLAAFLAREDIVAAPEPETYSKPSPAETEEGLAPDIADLLVDL